MLPGFRFLFAAIILSMSVLVFGLGAAALLRAAHEEFASLPSRRIPPEPFFARRNDQIPTLALLRVEPEVAEKPSAEDAAAAAQEIVKEIAPDIPAPAEQAADAEPLQPEQQAALNPEQPAQAEAAAGPETPATEAIAQTPAAPAEAESPVANAEANLAAIVEAPEPPAAVVAATPAEPARDGPSLEDNIAAIAALGGPAVIVDEKTSAKTTDANPDRSAVKKRAAQRARERRRAAARRARLAREAALAAQQQQADPFSPAPVVRRTR
jgi:hypothetical protein